MSLTPEYYRGAASLLARCDARWRFVSFVGAVVTVSFLREPWPSLVALLVAMVVFVVGRVPWSWARPRLWIVAGTLVPFVLLVPFTVSRGEVWWAWYWLRLTDAGLLITGVLILKTFTMTLFVLTLLASGPLPTLFAAAGRVGVPKLLVQIALLAYRYLFVLLDELNRLRVALRVRAFRNAMNRHSFRTIGQVTGTLLVRGSDRAERVAHAMRCRGFDGRVRSRQTYRTTWRDLLLFVGLLGIMTSLLVWDVLE